MILHHGKTSVYRVFCQFLKNFDFPYFSSYRKVSPHPPLNFLPKDNRLSKLDPGYLPIYQTFSATFSSFWQFNLFSGAVLAISGHFEKFGYIGLLL